MSIVGKAKKHHIDNLKKVNNKLKKKETDCDEKKLKRDLRKLFGNEHGKITKQELNIYLTKVFTCSLNKDDIQKGLIPTPYTLAKITSDRAFNISDFEKDKTLTVYQFEHFFYQDAVERKIFPVSKQKGGGVIGRTFNKFVNTITVKTLDEQCIIDSSKKLASQRVWKNISDYQVAVFRDARGCSKKKGYRFFRNIGVILLKVLFVYAMVYVNTQSKRGEKSNKSDLIARYVSRAGILGTIISWNYDTYHLLFKEDKDLDQKSIKEWNEYNPIDKTMPLKWWRDWVYTFTREIIYRILKTATRGNLGARIGLEVGDIGARIFKNTVTTPSEYKKKSDRWKKLKN
jgi:hypothetical protein